MTTRSNGPLAGFGWLKRGINVGHGNPKALLGGASLLLLACLVPSLVTLPIRFHGLDAGTPPDTMTIVWIMVVSAIAGLLVLPLYAGYLQVIDAAERGLPTRARDIFNPYRQGDAPRLMGYGLAMLLVNAALLGGVIAATGGGLVRWYMQALAAQSHHQPPPVALPDGFGLAIALFVVIGLFLMGVYAISLGQLTFHRRGVFDAIGDGVVGALKNLLPLLVFAVGLVIAWLVIAIAVALLVVLLALLGKIVGTWLVLALVVPLYVVLVVMLLAAMFGVMYHLWRDVCGDETLPTDARALAA